MSVISYTNLFEIIDFTTVYFYHENNDHLSVLVRAF